MNRKYFLGSLLSLSAPAQLLADSGAILKSRSSEEEARPVLPANLQQGDIVAITSPAGFITTEEIQPAVKKLEEWGFRVKLGSSIGKKDFTFGGTDEERRADLQQMLDDKEVKAILCARGGYGSVRIIDQLDFKLFRRFPKWIIGFSDITVIHCHINRHCNTATIHSKMCNSFPVDWASAEPVQRESIDSIRKCLVGAVVQYEVTPAAHNKTGKASGILVGGNLKTLETLAGSDSDLRTANKILFVEDTGEYLYSIDRMFWNLKRSGKLSALSGLIVGGFKIKKDEEGEDFGKSLEEIVLEKVKEYDYPVCFDFPVGHQKNNMALKCGALHTLEVGTEKVVLSEAGHNAPVKPY